MTSNQLKVVFNQDGSIKVFEFPKYITQGSNGATKLTVAIDGANIQGKAVIARFKLEGEQSDTTNTLVFNIIEPSVEVYGDTYNYAKSVYLTAAQTAFAGVLLCSIEVFNADNILYSYSCRLTINPTTYNPDSTDTMINNAQYENLVEMLNFATELVSHNIEYVDNISSASASDYNEGMIIFNKANRFWYEVKNNAFVRLNALFIGTGNGEGSGTITADQFNTIKEDTLVITPYTNIFRCQNKSVTDNGNTVTWTFIAKSASWLQSNDYRVCLVRKSGSSYNYYFYSLSNYVYYGQRDGFDENGEGYRDAAVSVSTFANSIFNVSGNEITGWNKDAKIITAWNIIYHLIDVAHDSANHQYVLYFANDDIKSGTNKAYQKHFRIVWEEGNSNTNCSFYKVGPDFKTVGGETILGSGNIAFKTINGNSIIGSGNVYVDSVIDFDASNKTLDDLAGSLLPTHQNYGMYHFTNLSIPGSLITEGFYEVWIYKNITVLTTSYNIEIRKLNSTTEIERWAGTNVSGSTSLMTLLSTIGNQYYSPIPTLNDVTRLYKHAIVLKETSGSSSSFTINIISTYSTAITSLADVAKLFDGTYGDFVSGKYNGNIRQIVGTEYVGTSTPAHLTIYYIKYGGLVGVSFDTTDYEAFVSDTVTRL